MSGRMFVAALAVAYLVVSAAIHTRQHARTQKELRRIMATIQDLAAKDAALAAELTTFLADIQAKLNSLGSLTPADQAVVDQLSTDLDSFTAQLQANDPGTPPPAPTP